MSERIFGLLVLFALATAHVAATPEPDGSEETLIICDGDRKTLECRPGFKLQIAFALYGRSSSYFCQTDERESPMRGQSVEPCASDVTKHVGRMCEERESCELTAGATHFDLGTCAGKAALAGKDLPFLEITYTCGL